MGEHRAGRSAHDRTSGASREGHSHGHGHGPPPQLEIAQGPRIVLLALLALAAVAVVVGAVTLWPDRGAVDRIQGSVGFAAAGVTFPTATVDSVQPACPVRDGNLTEGKDCGQVRVTVDDGVDRGTRTTLAVPPEVSAAGLSAGDHLELTRTPAADNGAGGQSSAETGAQAGSRAGAQFAYFGIDRDRPLWLLGGLFVLVVVAVGRLRGLMAIVGLAVAGLVIGGFVLPALLTGEAAVPVALVGAAAILYVVLYSTHGLSIRTSAALGGTLLGVAVTALVGSWAVGSTHLTGVQSESGGLLTTFASGLDFQDLLVAAVVIASLGVLNDVTITQASSVWELRAAAPAMSRSRLFTSAMRIGRDHIASTIYTLVFAYAGTALSLLLVISLYDRPWLQLVGTEEVAEELVASLVGSIGLVLAVPLTTLIAVLTVPAPVEAWLAESRLSVGAR